MCSFCLDYDLYFFLVLMKFGKMKSHSTVGALALASSVIAQNVTNCFSQGVCYAVNVPETTASSGSGDMYIQISGPSSMSWIGVGQGTSMTGANIFMIYANAAGDNVTLSPRLGVGNGQPVAGSSTANLTLLEGSGISNGMMTANFRCSNCNSWEGGSMSFTDAKSSWIWAYLSGDAISSDSQDVRLPLHNGHGDMILNLQSAAGGSGANPFLSVTAAASPLAESNPGSSSNQSRGSGVPSNFTSILMAHGILAPIALVLFFPLGAISMRLLNFKGLVWFHAGWMLFTYMVVLVAMGMGVWIAVTIKLLESYHAIIGLVVAGCLLLQPITGLLHHLLYKTRGRPNAASYPHIWWGRAVITLGIINGGLGLKLAGNTRNGEIVYGVVAGVMWVLWMAVILLSFIRSRGKREGESGDTVMGAPSHDSNEKMRQSKSL